MLHTTNIQGRASSLSVEKAPAPHSGLTYPRHIFILGLFDHGNERRPVVWREDPLLSRLQPHSLLRVQVWARSGVRAGDTSPSAIGRHWLCKPASPNRPVGLNPTSVSRIRPRHHAEEDYCKVFTAPPRSHEEKPQTSSKLASFLKAHGHLTDWLCIHAPYEYETSQQV